MLGAPDTDRFDGVDGLARLSTAASFSAPDAAGFHARTTRVRLDHVALQVFAAGPHRGGLSGWRPAAGEPGVLTFAVILEGAVRMRLAGAEFTVEAGRWAVFDSRASVAWSTDGDLRVLVAAVGTEHVPQALQRRGTALPGALERTALVDAAVAFDFSVLRAAAAGRRPHGARLVSAVADLHAAVLAEAQELADAGGETVLRRRAEQHIEAHLADPALSPQRIAAALGISVRHLHGVFNEGDRTVARFLRERRVDAAASELRRGGAPVPQAELARRSGFRSPDALVRAFRQRLGTTPRAYRELHR